MMNSSKLNSEGLFQLIVNLLLAKIQNDIAWFHTKSLFSKYQNRVDFKNLDYSEVLSGNFPGLNTSTASLIPSASATSLASPASTALFPQKTYWSWWSENSWHQNDQYWSCFVKWITKHPIFHWNLVPFLSESVEASLCYFFEKWLTKLKCPILWNIQILSS